MITTLELHPNQGDIILDGVIFIKFTSGYILPLLKADLHVERHLFACSLKIQACF